MRHGKSNPNLKFARGIFRTAKQSDEGGFGKKRRDVAASRVTTEKSGRSDTSFCCDRPIWQPKNGTSRNNNTTNSLAPLSR